MGRIVRKGRFRDLPKDIKRTVLIIYKMIDTEINKMLEKPNYQGIKEDKEMMGKINTFLTAPSSKSKLGSVQAFKNGPKYEIMIQCTGHFDHTDDKKSNILHKFISIAFENLRPRVHKLYGYTLRSECKEKDEKPFEGFDVYPPISRGKMIWEILSGSKETVIKENSDGIGIFGKSFDIETFDEGLFISLNEDDKSIEESLQSLADEVNVTDDINVISHPVKIINESVYGKSYPIEDKDDVITESLVSEEMLAKRTMGSLSASIISDPDKNVTQYTANTYANIITKNLLSIWAKGYRKFSISLDSYQSGTKVSFKIPAMSQDFVSRFIDGRETITGFLHRSPEIKVKISPQVFHSMKDKDDAFNFFKALIQYYDSKVDKYSHSLMTEIMKFTTPMKHLISTTKLSGLVTLPMAMLFSFDNVDMTNKDTFKVTGDNVATVNKFIRNIASRYAAPEKEKKAIIDDLKSVIKELQASTEIKESVSFNEFAESLNDLFNGKYDSALLEKKERLIAEQIDREWDKSKSGQTRYISEKFGVKKLKKIPADLVAYITIETEAIKDVNDKMMISSYCLGKIEIVEWYIELLDVGSNKYIVPHTKPYLETVRTQLLACFKKIMDFKIPQKDDSIIPKYNYPKGYEG